MHNNPVQLWFEMPEIRRKPIANGVWIPLRQSETISYAENQEEVICVGTVAIANEHLDIGNKLDWDDIGLIHDPEPYAFSDGRYKPADVYLHNEKDAIGVELVLKQHVNSAHKSIWRVNQDLIMALGLIEDGDAWVRPDEGYIDVIRCRHDSEGQFVAIEIRAEFLRDYLSARGLALRIASYRQRMAKVDDSTYLEWSATPIEINTENERFSTRVFEIDADGGLFGSVAVMKVWRTDVDDNEDVPVFGDETDQNTAYESHRYERTGPKLFRVEGELWRTEWVEPATISERVRRDKPTEEFFYLVGAAGEKLPSSALNNEDVGRWLWFRPQVVETLLEHKGSDLGWYTFDTGMVKCSPDYGTHFGVNKVGLINVYAYDIAKLPQWQQRLWVGHNVAPDGQVSSELLDSQMRANPAATRAPEADFEKLLNMLNQIFIKRYGGALFRSHDSKAEIQSRIHRFRATSSKAGLLELAKDIARLTADSIDESLLREIVKPDKDQKLGTLKLMERLLAMSEGDEVAKGIMTSLVGIYDLRLGDAHLPSSKINEAYMLLKIDVNSHPISQATQMLTQAVNSLHEILRVLSK
ncbi:MAG: hypothetical protein HOO85_03730 [Methylotenera sp.]|nr:hypothetical protein [Methylotenera sp.]